jgi:hypothetical protein
MWEGAYDDVHREYMVMANKRLAFIETPVAERLKQREKRLY